MNALTLHRPWPWAILHPQGKRLENRTWMPVPSVLGQVIALHAGKTWDYDGCAAIRTLLPDVPRSSDFHPLGIVGVARVVGVVNNVGDVWLGQRPWFSGPYAWVLEDVRALPRAIPCRGAQGLWDVTPEMQALIEKGLSNG